MDFLKHIACARLDSQSSFYHDAKPSAGHLGARRWKTLSLLSLSLSPTHAHVLFFTTLHFSLCNYYTLPSLFIPPTFYSFTYFYPTHALLSLSLSHTHTYTHTSAQVSVDRHMKTTAGPKEEEEDFEFSSEDEKWRKETSWEIVDPR